MNSVLLPSVVLERSDAFPQTRQRSTSPSGQPPVYLILLLPFLLPHLPLLMLNFNAFRFRLRPRPAPSSSEDESDLSSPEHPFTIRISVPNTADGLPPKSPNVLSSLSLVDHTPRTQLVHSQSRSSSKPALVSLPNNAPSTSLSAKRPTPLSNRTLIRRVTSTLHISIPTSKPLSPNHSHSPSSHRDMNLPVHLPRSPRVTIPTSPTLPNSFVSKECREAALRERGLIPPRPDLSQQEREADERLAFLPPTPDPMADGLSAAERLKEEWIATNRTSESSSSDCALPVVPLRLNSQTRRHRSSSISDSSCQTSSAEGDYPRLSHDGKTDSQLVGRPSISSTVPPLSTSSYLEVLQEEPSEQVPVTPPLHVHIQPPIIVSTPVEGAFPPSPVVFESPISCSFPAYLDPASISQPQLSTPGMPTLPEKENNGASFPPPPASRRRTTDSGDRRRKSVGQTLSKFGTNSLSNLRRSVGSIRSSSTTTFSTADLPPSPTLPLHLAAQTPRMALSPTMHSRGSILLETRDIKDAESRRLCEMAFLD